MAWKRKISDAALIRRCLAGDQRAFLALVRRHEQPLAALIRRYVEDLHHAEDVLQETLAMAWASLRGLRDSRRFRAWLLAVARNRCRDFHKSAQRRHRPTDEARLARYVNRYGRAASNTDHATGEAIDSIDRIPAAEGQVARMFYLQQMTIREIAERVRRPEGSIKRLLHHARKRLREAMQSERSE